MRNIFEQKLKQSFPWIKSWHHLENKPIDPRFGTGDGWYPVWHNMLREIEDAYAKEGRTPDLVILDSKEKYGSLRFYYGSKTEEPDEVCGIVAKYMMLSEKTCDRCGQPSELNWKGALVTAECEACRKRRDACKHYEVPAEDILKLAGGDKGERK